MKISNLKLFFKLPLAEQISNFISHPLFSGSAIMIVGSNTANALNYLYHLAAGRLLGPSLYGELAALISVIGLLGIIPGSVSLVIIKEISSTKDDSKVNQLISWFKRKIFIASLIFSSAVLIFSPVISSFLNIDKVIYLMLISLSFFFSLQAGFNRAILQGILKFKEMVISILAENGVKLILSVILIYIGLQINGAILAFILASILGWYITNYFLRQNTSATLTLSPDVKAMFKFTVPVVIQTIAVTSLYTTDVILVKHFFPSHDVGIYASLSTLGKIIFFATGSIGAVMFPLVSQKKAKGESFRKIFILSFVATGLFAAGSLIIYWLFPSLVIKLLYGSAYLEAEKLLVWFGLFISLFTLASLMITYNLSLGKTKVTILPMVAALAQIILIYLFHQTLFMVIITSTLVTALLLVSLLIYSNYEKLFFQ